MNIVDRSTFNATGTNVARAIIPATNGMIRSTNLNLYSAAAGTLKFYLASQKCKANAAVAADTTLVVKTDAAGKIDGAVLTTADFVIVSNRTSGDQFSSIAAVGAVSSSTVSLTLGTAVTCSANDIVCIVRAVNIISRATANPETVVDAKNQFNGFKGYPVAVEVTATGSDYVNGTYDIEM